jgi:ABC-type dipeptide/oligopeptide/nickel transport system permease subunit
MLDLAAAGGEAMKVDRRARPRVRVSTAIAAILLGAFVLCAAFAPLIAPYDPNDTNPSSALAPMSWSHWFGTDSVGRDAFSRIIFGARTSLVAIVITLVVAAGLGVVPGLIAGYYRGPIDALMMKLSDAITAFPPLVFAIAIVAVLGTSLTNAMLAVGVLLVPRFFRLMRAVALELREKAFVEAAKASGTSRLGIVFRHLLPNALSPLVVQLGFTAGLAIIAESSLSFVGLGSQPPTASWGNMVSQALPYLEDNPHLIIVPGVVVTLAVLSFNMLGNTLRDRWGRDG